MFHVGCVKKCLLGFQEYRIKYVKIAGKNKWQTLNHNLDILMD